MTSLVRFKNVMRDFPGGPGVNVMYFSAGVGQPDTSAIAQAAYLELWTSYVAIQGFYAPGVTIEVDATPMVVDSATGNVTGVETITEPQQIITSTSVTSLAPRGVAALLQMRTDIWRDGRRLAGHAFLGPFSDDGLKGDGLIAVLDQETIAEAFSGLINGLGPKMAVYSRPKTDKITHEVVREGFYGDVTQLSVPARPSYLRSRMD